MQSEEVAMQHPRGREIVDQHPSCYHKVSGIQYCSCLVTLAYAQPHSLKTFSSLDDEGTNVHPGISKFLDTDEWFKACRWAGLWPIIFGDKMVHL